MGVMKEINCRLCGVKMKVSHAAISAVCSSCISSGWYTEDKKRKQEEKFLIQEEKQKKKTVKNNKDQSRTARIKELCCQGVDREKMVEISKVIDSVPSNDGGC